MPDCTNSKQVEADNLEKKLEYHYGFWKGFKTQNDTAVFSFCTSTGILSTNILSRTTLSALLVAEKL